MEMDMLYSCRALGGAELQQLEQAAPIPHVLPKQQDTFVCVAWLVRRGNDLRYAAADASLALARNLDWTKPM